LIKTTNFLKICVYYCYISGRTRGSASSLPSYDEVMRQPRWYRSRFV